MAYATPGRPFQPPDTFRQSEGKPRPPGLETLMRNQASSSKSHTAREPHTEPEPRNATPEPRNVTPEPHSTAPTNRMNEPSDARSATPNLRTITSSTASGPTRDFGDSSTHESVSDEESDNDTEMADATSNFGANPDTVEAYSIGQTQDEHGDVLGRIANWFRLLDLVDEHGSGGIVEKVVIDQVSLHRFLNLVRPGSYDSVSKINIKSLDKLSIKPVGIYGDRAEIIKFLQDMGCLDANSAALLSQLSSEASEDAPPVLRSGLYLALNQGPEVRGSTKHAYIVYWPEDTTWNDQVASSSVRRNRVTFMRYLTKLADQKISLVSRSQARAFVWDARAHNKDLPEDQQEHDDDARLFSFEVAKSLEQEEDAVASPGFMVPVEDRHLPDSGVNVRVDLVSGEEKAALLVSTFEEARINREQVSSQSASQMALQKMIQSTSVPLQLGNLSPESLELLARNGLRERFKGLFGTYDQKVQAADRRLSKSKAEDKRSIDHKLNSDEWKLKVQVRNIIRSVFDGVFPSINVQFDTSINSETSDLLYDHYPGLHNTADLIRQKHNWTVVGNPTFRSLKRKWFIIRAHLEGNSELSEREQHAIIDRVLKGDETLPGANPREDERSSEHSGWLSYAAATARAVTRRVSAGASASQSSHGIVAHRPVPHLSDSEFVALLQPLEQVYPSLRGITSRIYDCLWEELEYVEKALLQAQTDEIIFAERQSRYKAAANARDPAILNDKKIAYDSLMDGLKEAIPSKSRNLVCVDSVRKAQYGAQYYWSGARITSLPAQNHYKIYPLELTEQDSQSCRTDEAHVPQPKLDIKHMFEFATAINRTVEFVQLVRDKCIVAVSEPGQTRIYVEDNVSLNQSINRNNGKVTLNHDSLGGPECMFAFDQATRLLAIVHGRKDIKLSIFIFDEHFANLRSRGSPIPIHRWYDTPVNLAKVCFVSGVEEVCLVEKSGRARIFSLVTQQFRNAHLQITCPIVNAFSAPDGSCLFVTTQDEHSPTTPERLLAFHWASFGPNSRGIDSTELPTSNAYRVATRFEGRGRVHVISFDAGSRMIRSTVLQIKQKATEFSFRSDREHARTTAAETFNNSLIDCHLEVWTRFPVMPAVSRNTLSPIRRCPPTLTFLSPFALNQVKEYFAAMIATFEQTTRKPMGGSLSAIVVESTDKLQHDWDDGVSEFQLGSFIVELLCLIPLHLAITRENRFIPLKDGVWDPKYEQTLLGADVPAIIDALSLGWYESLFQSYMATKPVRVVSSMGEQSVGKSYCLNHFADTSFAGSAMRTTEGVWLSCTPTEDYLLVSLDFEGVHSIERSAQEDALLVLFNTAISNLVLFRNNFAISRDIAGLFTSFQSSAMVLDPNANRGLFNSTLAIIIKDVTNADASDIVREFSLKFQRIVEKEQDQNFISRLHRGRIQIIPWPVINSPNFYSLFLRLRQQLDKQKFTHGNGGAFLHNLKTLMAKIKASDWGALDQNLATHRAQQLIERLPSALCYGRIDQGPLKNMDTDEEVPAPDNMLTFFVPEFAGGDSNGNEIEAEGALKALIRDCTTISRFQPPTTDIQYVEALQQFIYGALDRRLALVQQWIAVNVERFPGGNQDIRNVTARLNSAALAMRAAVRICSSRCAGCLLLCLHTRGHTGEHTCGTDHRCVFDCEVAEGHVQNEPCGLPAGHGGKHMCNVKAHSCGEECQLSKMGGCAQSCTKPMFHEGEHICSARSHLCGKPCDLRNAKQGRKHGVYSCPGTCNVPWDEPHERHTCDNARACPMECFLCLRLCSHTDHFHGLESGATHLCGQEHICTSLCEADGICQIETRPSAIQEQFAGRHESFMYTRYTQVDRRLSCVIPIPPGELKHDGAHTHDTAPDVFHFCDARCPNCEYLCTLPLGHPQQLHETSHGSMITTQWAVEGDDANQGYELDGRKFGSGDEGAPMLCNLVCSAQGRHAHIDYCRSVDPDGCNDRDCEHIPTRMHPEPDRPKDWISHATHWARSGFRDPYSQDEQVEFAKCDVFCAGPEHEATATSPENPSRCILPIFHAPMPPRPAPPTGHVSVDGHHFDCQNPSRLHQSYHIVFVIDSSGSMGCQDHQPLPNTPVSPQLVTRCNNRYGAVLSALYGFWLSRENVMAAAANQARQDAYSVVTFDHNSETRVENDFTSTTDQLVDQLIAEMDDGGTNFHGALARAQAVIEANWSSDRAPVIVFLSDGEARLDDNPVYDLCQMCVGRGKPLAFYSVSFGTDTYSASLRRMAEIGREVYATAPQDVLTTVRGNPCAYTNAIDSITLADTFLGIANSLQKPRASLISQHAGRRAMF